MWHAACMDGCTVWGCMHAWMEGVCCQACMPERWADMQYSVEGHACMFRGRWWMHACICRYSMHTVCMQYEYNSPGVVYDEYLSFQHAVKWRIGLFRRKRHLAKRPNGCKKRKRWQKVSHFVFSGFVKCWFGWKGGLPTLWRVGCSSWWMTFVIHVHWHWSFFLIGIEANAPAA